MFGFQLGEGFGQAGRFAFNFFEVGFGVLAGLHRLRFLNPGTGQFILKLELFRLQPAENIACFEVTLLLALDIIFKLFNACCQFLLALGGELGFAVEGIFLNFQTMQAGGAFGLCIAERFDLVGSLRMGADSLGLGGCRFGNGAQDAGKFPLFLFHCLAKSSPVQKLPEGFGFANCQ